jgi:hypothetical protein
VVPRYSGGATKKPMSPAMLRAGAIVLQGGALMLPARAAVLPAMLPARVVVLPSGTAVLPARAVVLPWGQRWRGAAIGGYVGRGGAARRTLQRAVVLPNGVDALPARSLAGLSSCHVGTMVRPVGADLSWRIFVSLF